MPLLRMLGLTRVCPALLDVVKFDLLAFYMCILVCVKHSRKQFFMRYGAFAYCIQFKAHG